jgi:ribosomal protein S18 acetylase RimI-like enzyme
VVALRPMTAEEFDAYQEGSVRDFAEHRVRNGNWTPEEALERSRAEFRRLLPQGLATPDHHFRSAFDAEGTRVGEVWYCRQAEARPIVFVYWLGVREEHRRRGHASAILREVEREAVRLGADRVGLHVFGDNAPGLALYRKLGFTATELRMERPARP